MLVFFALGNAKVLSFALGDAKVPNANGFASQWNIGFTLTLSPHPKRNCYAGHSYLCVLCHENPCKLQFVLSFVRFCKACCNDNS